MRLEQVSRSKEIIGTKYKMFQNPKWLTQSNKSHIYYKVETLTVIAVTQSSSTFRWQRTYKELCPACAVIHHSAHTHTVTTVITNQQVYHSLTENKQLIKIILTHPHDSKSNCTALFILQSAYPPYFLQQNFICH